ncbi:MAG: acyl carrier protein [Betaproteobacteria bacterium]|nr:acyl carrier protein [Betaproteobacteria bacterium]
MSKTELTTELKQLIIDACEKDLTVADLGDHDLLFGPEAKLALDSLDALQISMALQKRYGVRLSDSKETRRILASVDNLAEYLQARPAP